MDWIRDLVIACVPVMAAGIAGIARRLRNMDNKLNEHGLTLARFADGAADRTRRLGEVEVEQDSCRSRCIETCERVSVIDERQENFKSSITEIKADLKDILRHLRGRNGV